MADLLTDDKPKIVNVKFNTEEEKKVHARFKSKCALRQEGMQQRILDLISADIEVD